MRSLWTLITFHKMAKFTYVLLTISCIAVIVQSGGSLKNEKEDDLNDDFSALSLDMKRSLKSSQRNLKLKIQTAVLKGLFKKLQTHQKNLHTQGKYLKTFKLMLQSKINKTQAQTSKKNKFESQIMKLSLKIKALAAHIAPIQAQVKNLGKQLKTFYLENSKLTGKSRKDCADLYKIGENKSGVYQIDPDGQGSFKVYCDMTSSGGGWTVFQRNELKGENFYRGWKEYKHGFGDLKGEFWLGLDKIYRLTTARKNKLRIDLTNKSGVKRYAAYGYFAVKNEAHKYQLSVGKYSGNIRDSLYEHNGMKFTTKDSDNDKRNNGNCAKQSRGGWWFHSCYSALLCSNHIWWSSWGGSMKFGEMKIKP
ncbi:angiopoietin-related protein 7-like [Xenia sp. Carnegie-2017]|uniref:angiopoietin-related protein 7-like n=1 Tax=Xenia sp. Carnegie-2017 TaxID=2897299 RepID=UPI001F047FC3|nr:angiopoietin-related protein 7-like [Xenia sp. Carnegie-2017]